jgi:PadR family transcriptional regulator PadR
LTGLKRMEFFVLVVLADGPRHGYGIVQDVERVSGRQVRPRPSNLYRVLDRMIEHGLLAEADMEPVTAGGAERRRFCRITPAGREAVRLEARLLADVLASSPWIRESVDGVVT